MQPEELERIRRAIRELPAAPSSTGVTKGPATELMTSLDRLEWLLARRQRLLHRLLEQRS